MTPSKDSLYDYVDTLSIEGDESAKEIIDIGYSVGYDVLYNFVDTKMIEGDERASKLLGK